MGCPFTFRLGKFLLDETQGEVLKLVNRILNPMVKTCMSLRGILLIVVNTSGNTCALMIHDSKSSIDAKKYSGESRQVGVDFKRGSHERKAGGHVTRNVA